MVILFNNKIRSLEHSTPQFYPEIKYMGLICLVFGLFPFENAFNSDGSVLKFKKVGILNIYSLFFHVGITVLMLIMLENFNEIRSLIRSYYVIFGFWAVFFSTQITNSPLLILIKQIIDFDRCLIEYDVKFEFERSKTRFLKLYTIFILIICTIIFLITNYESSEFYENEEYTSHRINSFIKIIVRVDVTLISFLYVSFCHSILERIKCINSLANNINSFSNYDLTKLLEQIRLLQSKLYSISIYLNSSFSFRLTTFFALEYIEILFVFYRDIIVLYNGIYVGVISIINLSLLLLIVSYYSQKMLLENQKMLKIFRNISLRDKDITCLIQIKELMKHMTAEPVTVSGGGYFKVTNGSLACLIGSLATMMTVILQIHQEYGQYMKTYDNTTDYNNIHTKH